MSNEGWNHLWLRCVRLGASTPVSKAETWQQDPISDPNPKPGLSCFLNLSPACTSPWKFCWAAVGAWPEHLPSQLSSGWDSAETQTGFPPCTDRFLSHRREISTLKIIVDDFHLQNFLKALQSFSRATHYLPTMQITKHKTKDTRALASHVHEHLFSLFTNTSSQETN